MARFQASIDLDTSDLSLLRIERHSFVNLVNVVHAELQLIERMAEIPGALRSAIHLAEAASRAFKEPRVARRHLDELTRFAELIESDVEDAMRSAGELASDEGVVEARSILAGVLEDANLRVQEVIARHAIERPLRAFDREELISAAGEITLACESDTVHLPAGFERILRAGDSASVLTIREVRITGSESITVDLCGSGPTENLEVVGQGLRPGELQRELERSGPALRSILLLAYLGLPESQLIVEEDDGSFCAGLTFAAQETI
jgi:hypothetical protein